MKHAYDRDTALLVVDVQNDFADPAGSLYVKGAEQAVEAANREIQQAVEAGAVVVYTQDWHPPHTPHFRQDGGVWPVHCVGDTWGAQFHPALHVVEGAPRVRKGTGGEDGYSAFTVRDPSSGQASGTELEALLHDRGVTTVAVAGLATDYCVKETVLDATAKGFAAVVVADAVRAVDLQPGDGERAFEDMRRAGARIA